MRSKLYNVLLFIVIMSIGKAEGQVVTPLDFSKSFDGKPTGVIRTIDVTSDEIWLGAENGLFGITGSSVHHFDALNSSLKTNYISSITRFDEDYHLVAAFGDGIYLLNRRHKTIEPFIVQHLDTRSVWSVDVSDTYIAISTIRDLHIVDKQSKRLLVSLSELSPDTVTDIRHLKLDDEQVWWLDISKGLRRLNLSSHSISYFAKSSYFPEATYLTAFMVESDNIFIGTNENVYRFDKQNHTVTPLIERDSIWDRTSDTAVFKLERDQSGKLWVAADRLYELNLSEKEIKTPDLLSPLLSSRAAEVVLDFTFDEEGNFFAADTQRGLFAIPVGAKGTHFLGGSLENSADTLYDISFDNNTEVLFTGDKRLFSYNPQQKSSVSYPLTILGPHFLIKSNAEEIKYIDQRGTFYTLNKLSGISSATNNFKNGYRKEITIKDVFSPDNETVFILLSNGEHDEVVKWRDDKATLLFEGELEKIAVADKNTVYVSALYDGIYRLNSENSSTSTEKLASLPYSGLTCLYLDTKSRLWMCGDGHGLSYLDESKKIENADNFPFQYIRGITEVDSERFLVATNAGLFIYSLSEKAYAPIGKQLGINDIDFEYGALHSSDKQLVVIGDNFSYLLDRKKLLSNLTSFEKERARVVFTGLQTFDSAENKVVDASERLLRRTENAINISYDEKMFELNLVVADYLSGAEKLIEYRLLGNNPRWYEAGRAEAAVNFSSLEPGSYELQARIKSNYRINEISTITIIVAPPWWQTPYAYAAYFLAGLLILIYAVLQIKARVAARNEELADKVDEQKQVLEQNQTYIRTILKRKHRALLNVAKEIQTPLTLILGPLQLVQDQPNDVDNPRRINVIARNARRLHLLINQITEVERLESSKSLPRQSYPIKEHFPVLLANLEPEITRKAIKLTARLKATGFISLLPESLEKIVYNLVRNAIAATPHGGEVTIETRCEALQLVIVVKDSGEALSESDAADVLERFAQNDADSEEEWLPGLAIAKEASLANSGWIGIDSKPGRGNRLSVYLPLINLSEEMPLSPPMVVDVVPRIPRIDDQRPIVLIVDDNPDMRQYLKDTLRLSYNCMEASQGKQALKTMQVIVPDLVISDGHMPECDGFALREAMVKTPALEDIPFILINDAQSDDMLEQCVELNIDSILEKPVEAATLRYTTGQLLSLLSRNKKASAPVTESSPFDVPAFANAKDQAFYTGFMQVLSKHYHDEAFNKCDAASLMAVSERQLSRKLLALFKMNFSEILKHYRIFHAKKLLDEGKQVTQVAYDVGFSTVSYFSRSFKIQCNETPSQYQERTVNSEVS